METVTDFIFLGSKIIAGSDCHHETKRCLLLGRKVMTNLDSVSKGRDITLMTRFHLVKAMVFPVVIMDVRVELKKSWVLKNWCFWTVVLEKTLESSLDCKEIKPVNPKGNQPWIFTGRTEVEAEAQYFGYCGELVGGTPPMAKVMRKEAGHTQRRDWASGVPLEILDHLPP